MTGDTKELILLVMLAVIILGGLAFLIFRVLTGPTRREHEALANKVSGIEQKLSDNLAETLNAIESSTWRTKGEVEKLAETANKAREQLWEKTNKDSDRIARVEASLLTFLENRNGLLTDIKNGN